MTRSVLVLNSGSSSVKYRLCNPIRARQWPRAWSIASVRKSSRLGRQAVADHAAALDVAFEALAADGHDLDDLGLAAVGHRVVHGGRTCTGPRSSTMR